MNLYGLIGYPLGHSFSQHYFTDKFIREDLANSHFQLFPLKDINEFPSLIHTHPSLLGLAVTIPYKESVIPYLTSVHPVAQEVGAVNCIKISRGNLTGFNTDIIGFEKSFSPLLMEHHQKALVLGTGGASKSVQNVLKKLGIEYVLVSRKNESLGHLHYSSINEKILQEHLIVINATPVGMEPNEDTLPELPYQFLSPRHLLYDLVYKPAETGFLQQGSLKGATTKNGFEMLIIQAEENWKIWNE